MRDLFICLLMNLKNHGKIESASMYDEELSSIMLVTDEGTYSISITKKNEALRNEN